MNEIIGIKVIVISNIYNFIYKNIVLKPTVVELEQGGPLGGLAHWAVNPSSAQKKIKKMPRILQLSAYAKITITKSPRQCQVLQNGSYLRNHSRLS